MTEFNRLNKLAVYCDCDDMVAHYRREPDRDRDVQGCYIELVEIARKARQRIATLEADLAEAQRERLNTVAICEAEVQEYRDAANAGTLRFQAEIADLRRRLAEWEERAIEFARIIGGRNEK